MATKKRLIDANETITAFTNWLTSRYDGRLPRDVVAEIPTVDAVEVVHGRWENPSKYGLSTMMDKLGNVCSACASYCDNRFNYCPHCGAKMDGGVKNA